MLGIVRGLQDKITVKEKEFKKYEIKEAEGGAYSWNPEKGSIEKEFEIGEREEDVIISALKKLNETKKLEQQHFTLYEKFVDKK